MWLQRMHIQVTAPKVETKLTNQPKTRWEQSLGFANNGRMSEQLTSLTARGDIEVDEEAEQSTKNHGGVWHTHAIDPLEYGRSLPFNGQAIESTGGNIQVRVGSAHHEDKDGAIDDVVEDFDTDQSGGNDEGGGSGSGLLAVGDKKSGIRSRDDETNDENTADIEDQDTPKGPPDGDRDVLPGILGLTNCDTDEFGSHVSKEGVDESGPEAKEGG